MQFLAPPKQSTWQITGNGGSMQYTNGLFREPDRLENGEKIKRPMNAFMVCLFFYSLFLLLYAQKKKTKETSR